MLGAVTIFGSLKVGIGWGAKGRSELLPFWVGLLIVASSAVNLVRPLTGAFAVRRMGDPQVLKIVWPMTLYVRRCRGWASVPSFVLTAGFMRWLGRYGWPLTLAISVGLHSHLPDIRSGSLVPLPRGALEDMLEL